MKAAQFSSYGGPEVIQINTFSNPTLKPGQILVENFAASINPIDWKVRAGYLQKMVPLQLPVTLGGDFAGKVVEIADDVSNVTVGDEVYGQASILNGSSGAMAEVVAANVANASLKPKRVNFEEGAALPLAGGSALQAIEEHIKLQEGQKILIHGGAGGIGHFAIQIAKALGGYVATTVSAKDSDFAKTLGADEVIDYKTQQFEEILRDYDAVFDTVGGETTDKSFRILKKGGVIVSMAGQPNLELAQKFGITAIGQKSKVDTARLNRLTELVESGKIKVHIDKIFSLEQAKEAFVHQEKDHPQGKVVIQIKA